MRKKILYNLKISAEAIIQNKLRAILTSLGIICGVASVIAMMAIGNGAQKEILEKMKLLGTNNIIIKKLDREEQKKQEEENANSEEENDKTLISSKNSSVGLSIKDAMSIQNNIPTVANVSTEIEINTKALHHGKQKDIKLIGINQHYFDANKLEVLEGNKISDFHIQNNKPVCVIGYGIKNKLFPGINPIGKTVKCGNNWLKVIGVMKEKTISKQQRMSFKLRDYNYDIVTPISVVLLNYQNRALITRKDLGRRRSQATENNYHQLDKIVVSLKSTKSIVETAEIIKRLLLRTHNQVNDFEMIVPQMLLEQEQSTKEIFNIVLAIIASISLLVGGIGIMNIMLASVMERTKEIGIRRAVGAKRFDIMLQFISEAVVISLSGGIIGIILGIVASYLIKNATDIAAIISPWSVIISFIVSISVGLIFGITPAKKAAYQDVISLLRYD